MWCSLLLCPISLNGPIHFSHRQMFPQYSQCSTHVYSLAQCCFHSVSVIVLLVYESAALLNTSRKKEPKYPLIGSYVLRSVRKMTSYISIFTAVLMKIKSCGIWRRVGCLNLQVLTSSILKCDGLKASRISWFFTIYTKSYPFRIKKKNSIHPKSIEFHRSVLMLVIMEWKFSPLWNKKKIVEEWKTNLMSLAILFHLLCAQHVSDINISIFRSLRLCCWITTSVVLFCKDGCFSN